MEDIYSLDSCSWVLVHRCRPEHTNLGPRTNSSLLSFFIHHIYCHCICYIAITHLPSASERAFSLFLPPQKWFDTGVLGGLVSEYVRTALSSRKSSRKCSVPQARLFVLRKPSCRPLCQKGHGKTCSWEAISVVSASTRAWTGQAGENVSIGPYSISYYTLNLNISDSFFFICQLILAHSLPWPQCHRRYYVILFHT